MALDREQHSQHSLKVMVTDQGHPRLNATATVHILVTDVNDNAPQFTHLPASKELNVQVTMILSREFSGLVVIAPYNCNIFALIMGVLQFLYFIDSDSQG